MDPDTAAASGWEMNLDFKCKNPTHPCPACPVEVRNLYVVAHNLLNLIHTPDRERAQRKMAERVEELREAVARMQPIVDAHFGDLYGQSN
jgi:hypothetical protein